MKAKVVSMELYLGLNQYRAVIEVETGWFRKKTDQRWAYGDGIVWRWHASDRRCPEWLEMKLSAAWSRFITKVAHEKEKADARSIEH